MADEQKSGGERSRKANMIIIDEYVSEEVKKKAEEYYNGLGRFLAITGLNCRCVLLPLESEDDPQPIIVEAK